MSQRGRGGRVGQGGRSVADRISLDNDFVILIHATSLTYPTPLTFLAHLTSLTPLTYPTHPAFLTQLTQ